MIRSMLPLLAAALAVPAVAQPPVPASVSEAAAPLAAATRLAQWQLAHFDDGTMRIGRVTDQTRNPRAWEQGVFWVGLSALAEATRSPELTAALRKMGVANGWQPGPRRYHADDHVIASAYLWAARNGAGSAAAAPTRAVLDRILAAPPRTGLAFYEGPGAASGACLDRWCWCDALFMAPPVWLELANRTGNAAYRDFALEEFWATKEFLYDPVEHLFYRDSRFFERRGQSGAKLFWSRGNGWVVAGMARSIPLLPAGRDRTRMTALYREMAARLKGLQKPDGYWAPSLLEGAGSPTESSGTGFYTFALAWGVNAGVLDRATYEPVVRRGWDALTRAIRPDGRLGYVQQVSDRPDTVHPDDTQYYGTGAFLLAATQIAKLDARATARK